MPPAGAWELQQAEESCSLVRHFGGDDRKLRLRIQSFGQTTPYNVVLVGDELPLRNQSSEAVQVGFGGQKAIETTVGLVGKAADGQAMLIFTANPPRPVSLLGWLYMGTKIKIRTTVDPAAETLYIDAEDMEPATLPLGPMETEYARLDACVQTLTDRWALAASGDAKPVSAPYLAVKSESNWRTKYPENMLLNRLSGLVEMRMTIDEKGRAHDCLVQASIWSKRFGEDACANFERWRQFEPARDAAGKPVRALYRAAVIYSIYDW